MSGMLAVALVPALLDGVDGFLVFALMVGAGIGAVAGLCASLLILLPIPMHWRIVVAAVAAGAVTLVTGAVFQLLFLWLTAVSVGVGAGAGAVTAVLMCRRLRSA